VDAPGEVTHLENLPHSWALSIRWSDPRFGRYVCEKASIAVDGISLTVAECSADGTTFTLAVIPHTWEATTLKHLAVGDTVNLEADQLARYAERLLHADAAAGQSRDEGLSSSWLAAHGWS
jgi:riboflavin synthase